MARRFRRISEGNSFSYLNYIEKNPLFLHNRWQDFNATLNDNIDISGGEKYLINYIRYLRRQEVEILKALGGKKEGKEALKILSDELTGSESNINKATNTLSKMTGGANEGSNFYVRAAGQGDIEIVDIINSKDEKIDEKKQKQNIFLHIPGAKLQLFVKSKRQANGKLRNVYNFERILNAPEDASKEAKELFEKEIKDFNDALTAYINTVKNGLDKYEKMLNEFKNFMNLESINTKNNSNNIKNTLETYINGINSYDGTITQQFLEFLIWADGAVNNTLKGSFNEAAGAKFNSKLCDAFGKGYKVIRGDQRTENKNDDTNKKPDIIYYEGKLGGINLNPITISQKVSSKKEGTVKAQTSPLLSSKEGKGIVERIAAEEKGNKKISKVLEYLALNDAFYPEVKALKIMNMIYKYFSYVFLSGSIKDERKDQAIFFMLTEGNDIKFLSMADILLNIYEGGNGNPITVDRLTSNSDLDEYDKLVRNAYYNKLGKYKPVRNKYTETIKERHKIYKNEVWAYQNLYDNQEIHNEIISLAGEEILYKARQIKASKGYISSRGVLI